jgi:ribosomal-protein-alanine N-acetyltransferase
MPDEPAFSGEIREAGPAYAPLLAALHRQAFPREPWGAEFFAQQLGLLGVFALSAGTAGFVLARVIADECEILTLAVAPESQRQGIGAALLRATMDRARARGARSMVLEVSTANGPALALYFRRGFREVGRRHQYYADGSDALVLAAQLTSPLFAAEGR